MKNRSLVSVIIPVYNEERYLAQAIESALAQTYRPVEIIIVDDGSTDDSAQVAKRFTSSVQYFHQPHSGLGAVRNYGADLAKGNYLAFLDADDIWMENKLTLQMAVLQSNPEADFVFGHVQQFISPELDENQRNKIYCPAEKMPGYIAGTMVIKRESFVRAGSFETNWQVGEFIDWYIKAKEKGLTSFMLPEVVLKRRLHADNMSRGHDSRNDYVRILKASLDRRRGTNKAIQKT
jgi:glycosyltransferase involved in cell wall biosynthesis